MEIRQKITKIGNSLGVILPKELREIIGVSEGSSLILKADKGKKWILISEETSEASYEPDPDFQKILKETEEEYRKVLEDLSKK
jgi:putative addiction module antidote